MLRTKCECHVVEGMNPTTQTKKKNDMYSIAEKTAQTGSVISRDNSRLWLRADGETTPASDEAAQFEFLDDAEKAATEAGLDVGENGWWVIVDLDEEEE